MARDQTAPRRFLGLDPFGWMVAGVLLLAAALYLPALTGGPIWDDNGMIDGRTIGGGRSLIACFTHPFNVAYYRPFVSASFYLDRQILGNNTLFYHQTNVLMHVGTVGLLIALVGCLFEDRRLGLLAGLLFAVQPVQMPAVAWIGGRTDALCTLFVAAYLLALVRWSKGSRWALPGAAIAFFGALMSKEQAILLLPLAPLIALIRPETRRMKPAAMATVAVLVPTAIFLGLCLLFYPDLGGATRSLRPRGVTVFGQTCLHYAMLFVAPEPSRLFTYSLASYRPEAMWAGLAVVASLAGGLVAIARRSLRTLWVAMAAVLALLPVSNLIPLPSLLVAPYRGGVVGLPIAALMALGLWSLATATGKWRAMAIVLGGVYIAYESILVLFGAAQYKSSEQFFTTAARYDPGCILLTQGLVHELIAAGDPRRASQVAENALDFALGPGRWRNLRDLPTLLHRDAGIEERIVASHGTKVGPNVLLGELLCSYGWTRERLGDDPSARLAYHSAATISPKDAQAFADEGTLVGKTDPNLGRRLVLQALQIDPHETQSLLYMAVDSERRGDWAGAKEYYLRSIRVRPWVGSLRLGVARAQWKLGNRDEALAQLDLAAKTVVNQEELMALRRQIQSETASRP